MHRLTLIGPLALAALLALTTATAHADAPLEPYALDAFGRTVAVDGPMRCPDVELVQHTGEHVRWKKALKVHPAFAQRLIAFEAVVAEVATRVYGRAPARITHFGSYNCRRIRRYPDLLSEHGLGNAIDVAGFEFAALSRAEKKTSKLPRALQRSFSATVLDHWHAEGPEHSAKAHHRRFLRELAAELERRPEIFRVMLGPAYPGHDNHFHFDCAPYRLVVL